MKKKIKAIFFDVDGTLLASNGKIPRSAFETLCECRKKGIKLFVATARPPLLKKMLGWTAEESGLFDGGAYCNGACEKIGDVASYLYIPAEIVEKVLECGKKYPRLNLALQLKNERQAFYLPLSDFAYPAWGIEKKDALDAAAVDQSEIAKILVFYENIVDSVTVLPREFVSELEKICLDKVKLYLTDGGKVVQIINKDVNKYEGVEGIRKRLGFEKSEIAVFGDDENDIEMLGGYENSVAMGSGNEKVKKAASYATKSSDDDGIAYALKEILGII